MIQVLVIICLLVNCSSHLLNLKQIQLRLDQKQVPIVKFRESLENMIQNQDTSHRLMDVNDYQTHYIRYIHCLRDKYYNKFHQVAKSSPFSRLAKEKVRLCQECHVHMMSAVPEKFRAEWRCEVGLWLLLCLMM